MATSGTEPDHDQQAPSSLVEFGLKEGNTNQSNSPNNDDDNNKSPKNNEPRASGADKQTCGLWSCLPIVPLHNLLSHLEPSDRLRASSTCRSWRNVLYTTTLWPQPHLRVNLCPHKFVLPDEEEINREKQKSGGFHTFALRNDPFGSNGDNYVRPHNQGQRSGNIRKTFNADLTLFVSKCAPFLTGLSIYFDPNSSHNVIDIIEIFSHLAKNEVPNYELNPSSSSTAYVNCRNLKSLNLVPITPLLRTAFSERFGYLYIDFIKTIKSLLPKCHRLEELLLGDLYELTSVAGLFLRLLSQSGRAQAIKRLNLSSIKGDVFHYNTRRCVPYRSLEKFTSIRYLSLDFDVLNTAAVNKLAQLNLLQSLTINVHHFNDQHIYGIEESSWTNLRSALPKLTATVNMMHTGWKHFNAVLESLINTDLPICCFRAYYLALKDELAQLMMCNLLDTLSFRHSETLETAVFVDQLQWPKRYLKSNAPNAFVMFTWRCRALLDLTIIGFELTDNECIAIARLRGSALRNFYFPGHCIELTKSPNASALQVEYEAENGQVNDALYYSSYHQVYYDNAPPAAQKAFDEAVSLPLERNWRPIDAHEIPECSQGYRYKSQMTYQRTLLDSSLFKL